jgi:hypothetical protein
MISDATFFKGITLLTSHYERKLLDDVVKIWKDYLSEHLDEVEFREAVKHSILHDRFMPTAGDLVNYIHGNKEAKAIQEWQLVLKASANCSDLSQLAYLDIRSNVALQAIGGLQSIGLADSYERQRLEKSFITVYCQCGSKDSKSLPQASSMPTQEGDRTPPESSPMPEHIKEQMEALKANFGGGKKRTEVPSIEPEEYVPSKRMPEHIRQEIEQMMTRKQEQVVANGGNPAPMKLSDLVLDIAVQELEF